MEQQQVAGHWPCHGWNNNLHHIIVWLIHYSSEFNIYHLYEGINNVRRHAQLNLKFTLMKCLLYKKVMGFFPVIHRESKIKFLDVMSIPISNFLI